MTEHEGRTFEATGTNEAMFVCAHCGKPIAMDERPVPRRYVGPNADGTGNEIKASMHEACWQAVYGSGVH